MTNRIIDLPVDPDLRSVLRDQIDSLLTTIETGDSYAMGQLDMAKAVMAMLKTAMPVVRTKAKAAKPTDWQREARLAAAAVVRAKTADDLAKASARLKAAQAEIAKANAKPSHVSEKTAGAVGCAAVAAPAVAPKSPAEVAANAARLKAAREAYLAKQAVKA